MMFKVARILVVSGIGLFCLRGVLGLLSPPALAAALVVLAAAAAALDGFVQAPGRCLIGELACREGLLSAPGVGRILLLQRREGGRFGEIAVRERYLSPDQLGRLLDLQAS